MNSRSPKPIVLQSVTRSLYHASAKSIKTPTSSPTYFLVGEEQKILAGFQKNIRKDT